MRWQSMFRDEVMYSSFFSLCFYSCQLTSSLWLVLPWKLVTGNKWNPSLLCIKWQISQSLNIAFDAFWYLQPLDELFVKILGCLICGVLTIEELKESYFCLSIWYPLEDNTNGTMTFNVVSFFCNGVFSFPVGERLIVFRFCIWYGLFWQEVDDNLIIVLKLHEVSRVYECVLWIWISRLYSLVR